MRQNPQDNFPELDQQWVIDENQDGNTLRVSASSGPDIYALAQAQSQQRKEAQRSQETTIPEQQSAPTSQQTQYAQHQQTTARSKSGIADESTSEANEGERITDGLGNVSEAWKSAASCLFLGSVSFLIALLAFIAYTLTMVAAFIYVFAGLSFVYTALRFGFSYFVYKDAKTLAYHSRDRRQKPWTDPDYGWDPNAKMWALLTFTMPPFVEYAPAAVYFFRRHYQTGVP